MINKTEQEIMKNWENENQIMVSITCVAYNHEQYIGKALDSFLMQDTNFAFEILIHDDVSTDKTAEIIKEYEKRFPNIIKPIYQTVNQFSQGINPMSFLFPKVQGEYIAFCDCDDYWIDNQKLKIQVEEMEKYPDINMSFHPAYELFHGKREKILAKHADKEKIFSSKEIVLGGGEFCPTASLVFRSQSLLDLPNSIKSMIPGDYPSQIIGSVNGGALYIDRCMSIYRLGDVGAWSSLTIENSEKQKKHLLSFHNMLNIVNNYLDKKFQKEIDELIYNSTLSFIKRRTVDISKRDEIFNLYKNIFSQKDIQLWYLLYKHQRLHNMLGELKKRVLA